MLQTIQEDPLDTEELKEALIKLVKARLTRKQKDVLIYLAEESPKTNVTRLVPILVGHLLCAPSTVWSNLNVLRTVGLVEFGDIGTKGKPIQLTVLGRLVAQELR
ncbi:MAG TPA: hypothetical protein VJG90_04415 [Candidatus Nanoarchaeia archaeon]|nr:hypothetical protein [Candidatus Nanoarchaeia archaeon]